MAKFEKGDNIIVHKPKDTTQFPGWNSAMDKFNGQILTISKINRDGMLEGTESECYCFHPDWCEKVESIPSVSLVDLGSFPNGFSGSPIYDSPQALSTEIDWEQRKWEASVAALSCVPARYKDHEGIWRCRDSSDIALEAIRIADEMIKQLKSK